MPIVVDTTESWHRTDLGSIQVHHAGGPAGRIDLEFPAGATVDADAVVERALAARGHVCAVIVDGETATIVSDTMRSHQLLWRWDDGTLRISDLASRLIDGSTPLLAPAVNEFRRAGFVLGDATLYDGVWQSLAGAVTRLAASGPVESRHERVLTGADAPARAHAAMRAEMSAAFDAVMRRAVEAAGGRQIAVPLSGGLDSRILLTWLAQHGHENLLAFTYGRPGSKEAAISRDVASQLGVAWRFVDYTRPRIRETWLSEPTARWMEFASNGTSLPHMQDYSAIEQLLATGDLQPDAIIMPGHTIVGNFHGDHLLEAGAATRASVRAELFAHHGALQHDDMPGRGSGHEAEADAFLTELGVGAADDSPLSADLAVFAVEAFNLVERQAKYINQSLRTYEWFGLSWSIPMLDAEFVEHWFSLPAEVRAGREVYGTWIDEAFAAAIAGDGPGRPALAPATDATGATTTTTTTTTTTDDATEAPRAAEAATPSSPAYYDPLALSRGAQRRIGAAARAVGADRLILRGARTVLSVRGGLVMERFLPQWPSVRAVRDVWNGSSLVTQYVDAFLADRWNPHLHLFRGRPVVDAPLPRLRRPAPAGDPGAHGARD